MTGTQQTLSETTKDLTNLNARLAELQSGRTELSQQIDELQTKYLAGSVTLDKLQPQQTELATLDDLIKSLTARREETSAANRLASDAQRKADRLAALDATDRAAADARLKYMAAFEKLDETLSREMPVLLELFADFLKISYSFTGGMTLEEYRQARSEVETYRTSLGRGNETFVVGFLSHLISINPPHGFASPIETALNIQRIKKGAAAK